PPHRWLEFLAAPLRRAFSAGSRLWEPKLRPNALASSRPGSPIDASSHDCEGPSTTPVGAALSRFPRLPFMPVIAFWTYVATEVPSTSERFITAAGSL